MVLVVSQVEVGSSFDGGLGWVLLDFVFAASPGWVVLSRCEGVFGLDFGMDDIDCETGNQVVSVGKVGFGALGFGDGLGMV